MSQEPQEEYVVNDEDSELAFDPDQDVEEKREIRRSYRKLQDDGERAMMV